LGYDRKKLFFMSSRGNIILDFTVGELSSNSLLYLADSSFWERNFKSPKARRPGLSKQVIQFIINTLLDLCHKKGVYSPEMSRGRGVWNDAGRLVVHLGDRIYVDGVVTSMERIDSIYAYEARPKYQPPLQPLNDEESRKFLALCRDLSWRDQLSGYMLAGFCVLGPICGLLSWRPSIWMTAASGSGKGWIQQNIVRPAFGNWGLYIEGNTTAFGINSLIQSDARPIVYDESEAESQQAQARIQMILNEIRIASSSSDSVQARGAIGGGVNLFKSKFMACLSSINVNLKELADETRITVLPLKQLSGEEGAKAFMRIKEKQRDCIKEGFNQRLIARTIANHKVLLTNIPTFISSCQKAFGEQRFADQMGTLLAGAYSLVTTKVISQDDCDEWVRNQNFTAVRAPIGKAEKDDQRLIRHIMESRVRLTVGKSDVWETTIAEMVSAVLDLEDKNIEPENKSRALAADDELRRTGIRVANGRLYFASNHSQIRNLLKGTNWATAKYHNTISQIDGAETHTGFRFQKGRVGGTSYCVSIPLSSLSSS